MPTPGNLTVARLLVAGAIAVVIVAIVALVIVLVLRGGPQGGSVSVAGLISYVGILVGLLGTLLAGLRIVSATANIQAQGQDLQEKMNGHLARHVGYSPEEVRAMVDEAVAKAVPRPPDGGAT